MIEVEQLTKRFGRVTVVRGLSFTVPAGAVTGLIGPNGAGKSTTMRTILGLTRPTSGRALIDGVEYGRLAAPGRLVGAVLDPHAVQSRRTTRDQLRWAATAIGVSRGRVDEVLEEVGLGPVASGPIAALSLGMRQRLALGVALLGRPAALILDEPFNGLDPQGIVWLRELLRQQAAGGGTVLVASHLLNELQETADRVALIVEGRLIAELSMAQLAAHGDGGTRVVTDAPARLSAALTRAGAEVHPIERADASAVLAAGSPAGAGQSVALQVHGLDSQAIGRIACSERVALAELVPQCGGLEETFLRLVAEQTK